VPLAFHHIESVRGEVTVGLSGLNDEILVKVCVVDRVGEELCLKTHPIMLDGREVGLVLREEIGSVDLYTATVSYGACKDQPWFPL